MASNTAQSWWSSIAAADYTITLRGPAAAPPASADAMMELGAGFWPLKLARRLDGTILSCRRLNEFDVAAIVFKSSGDPAEVMAYEHFLDANKDHWLTGEIRHYWKRVLKRVDLTSRSLVTLIEPGSCFAGTLAELAFASDRSYMLLGQREAATAVSDHCAERGQFRRLSDVAWPHQARQPFPC